MSPSPVPSVAPTLACSSGSYFDGTSCVLCTVGRYSNTASPPWATNCSVCSAGTYANEAGASECAACPFGKLSSADRTLCVDCQAGEYIRNQTECVACEEGRYAPQPQTGSCLVCGPGSSTSAASGASSCSPCNPGSFSLGATSACTLCALGRFSTSGQSACFDCDAGKSASELGSPSCTPCPLGYGSTAGASTCDLADEGFFLKAGVATECPSYSSCFGDTFLPHPDRGFWVDRRSLRYADDIYRCPRSTCVPAISMNAGPSSYSASDTGRFRRRLGSESCWELESYGRTSAVTVEADDDAGDGDGDGDGGTFSCNSDKLLCMKGSGGPLCGSCETGFIYSSSDRVCIGCRFSQLRAAIVHGACAVLGLAALAVVVWSRRNGGKLPAWVETSGVWGILKWVDSGSLRVAWSNYQIIQSVTWSIDVDFPSPFKEMMSLMSFFSFDFLSLECLFEKSNHFVSVYVWSLAPALAAVLLVLVHAVRRSFNKAVPSSSRCYQLLVLGYLVLPPVSLKHFQALDCVTVAQRTYLRIDTSIDCSTKAYQTFRVVNGCLIAAYLSIPLLWLGLLLAHRNRLNPAPTTGSDKKLALFLRDNDEGPEPLRFLFAAYKPFFFYAERIET